MNRFSLTAVLVLSVTPKLFAVDERPRVELKGLFGAASFTDSERHDVAGAGVRFNITDRFSIEPEVLFMRAPLDCYRCESGRDEDTVAVSNFVYRLGAPDPGQRLSPYFVAGVGYMQHRERWDEHDSKNGSLWMHFGLGLEIRITERLSLTPEYRVGADGGYATLSASYGWFPAGGARSTTRGEEHVVASSMEALRERLPKGGRVNLRDVSGERLSGFLESMAESGETLMLRAGERSTEIPFDDVYRIDARVSDPLTNGIYIGGGVGAGLGLLALTGCDCGGEVYGLLFMTGLGAGIGMLVDAAVFSNEIVYLKPPGAGAGAAPGVQFRLAPYMTRDKKGLVAVLGF